MPTSNFEVFRQHLLNPNKPFDLSVQEGNVMKVAKNLVLSYVSDSTGCGHIRNIFPMTYLNSIFGKTGRFNIMISPVMIFQHDVLLRCRSIFFQRTMAPGHIQAVQMYKDNQPKYGYKMVYDIDDFIWNGPDEGESIPDYNFGKDGIKEDVMKSCLEIMDKMDVVCVSTDFLGQYIRDHGVIHPEIKTVYNAVPQYFWGPHRKRPIKEKITRPRVIYTGSPTHYNNQKRLKGDWENAWTEWVIKNVMDKKIEFCCMGGLPFFFESIKDKIKIIDWVNSYQYHLPIKEYRADIGIAPLVPNYFNYSKSDIKHIEYCSLGILSIGTVFTNGKPSPYDNNFLKVTEKCSVRDIDLIVDEYTEPDNYNRIIKQQYQMMDKNGRWLESPGYVKMITDII
jgi:hypothetical protein